MDYAREIQNTDQMLDDAFNHLGASYESRSPEEYGRATAIATAACARYLSVIAQLLASQEGR
jgi:hypothetical protein